MAGWDSEGYQVRRSSISIPTNFRSDPLKPGRAGEIAVRRELLNESRLAAPKNIEYIKRFIALRLAIEIRSTTHAAIETSPSRKIVEVVRI